VHRSHQRSLPPQPAAAFLHPTRVSDRSQTTLDYFSATAYGRRCFFLMAMSHCHATGAKIDLQALHGIA
jgi:hypothetical protein